MATPKVERNILGMILPLILRHWRLSLTFLIAGVSGAITVHYAFPAYKASSMLYLRSPDTSPILSATAKITGYRVNEFSNSPLNQSYLKTLNSQSLARFIEQSLSRDFSAFGPLSDELLSAYDLETREPSTDQLREFAEELVQGVLFKGKDEDLIEIMAVTDNPQTAVQTANLMNQIAISYLIDFESKEVADIEAFLKNEVLKTQNRINKLSQELEAFKGQQFQLNLSHGGGSLVPQQSLARLREELELIAVRLQENDSLTKSIEQEISQMTGRGPASDSEKADYEYRGDMRGRILDKLRALKEERQSLEAKHNALRERLKDLTRGIKPEYEQKTYEFTKKLETEHLLYQELMRQLSDLNVYRISVGNRLRPYSSARLESAPRETPLSRRLILAALVSLILVFVIVYLWEQINPVVTSKTDLLAQGIVPLGSLPIVGLKPSLFTAMQAWLAGVPRPTEGRQWDSLSFQFLRARVVNLLRKRPGEGQIVSIISASAGDGKSFVCANLAILLGRMRFRTLVIDCDIVKSTMSTFFKVSEVHGLTDVLNGTGRLEDLVHEAESPNVYFLPSGQGTQNLEMFANPALKQLFEDLKTKYDVVILDTPACMARPESLLLANEADHILVVANAFETKMREVREMIEGLNPDKLMHLYGVLNRHEEILQNPYQTYHMYAYSAEKGGTNGRS